VLKLGAVKQGSYVVLATYIFAGFEAILNANKL
jgi:hypothetical protein